MRRQHRLVVYAIVASLALTGCAAEREAKFTDAALLDVGTDQVVLMPVIDQRENRLDPFDVGRHVRSAAGKVLAKKGYTMLTSRLLQGAERPPFEGFAALTAQELSRLGPDGSELLLFIAVDGVSHDYDRFGDEYYVRVSGVLVDRRLERVIWRDSSNGSTNFGGLLSLMSPAGSKYDAVYEAVMTLFRTVPDRGEVEHARFRKRS